MRERGNRFAAARQSGKTRRDGLQHAAAGGECGHDRCEECVSHASLAPLLASQQPKLTRTAEPTPGARIKGFPLRRSNANLKDSPVPMRCNASVGHQT